MSIINEIKYRYKGGNIVEKLIYINLAVFVLTVLSSLFKSVGEINWIFEWFSLDDTYKALFLKPWTIISYGFLHDGFIHILFNLFTLYFIGNLFLDYFTQKQLLTFYLWGTFFGGLLYIISQNYFPLFERSSSLLVGASAGISAIFIGIATYIPNYQLKIRFVGFVKLWHLAVIWVGLDVLGLAGANAGGHFAHLGGTLFGFFYVRQASNKQISIFSSLSTLFKSKKKPLKTVYKSGKTAQKKASNPSLNQQQIDAILDKISKSGYDTLTKEEKAFLFKQGK